MSIHSKREISFYKGIDPGVTLSLFHSHCIVSGTSSVSSNSKTTDSKTFDSMVVLTEEARIELPTVDPKAQSIHIQMDSIAALSYLGKMWGT